jgi:hypothetical protein
VGVNTSRSYHNINKNVVSQFCQNMSNLNWLTEVTTPLKAFEKVSLDELLN